MTSANCPNCGAPVQFRYAQAVQTTCPFCRSILVRHDVNLEKVGEVAELPPDVSPIQIATEGTFRNRAFVVVGRILYQYELGGWNEWHIVFSDGQSAWLSDAMALYDVSFLTQAPAGLPGPEGLQRGQVFDWNSTQYIVTVITHAHYRGVEGELPFQYWDKKDAVFADLRTADAKFATIDYSQQPTLLYMGEAVEFEDLGLKNLRQFEGWS